MIYKVTFGTNIGAISFFWRGQEYVEIYYGADETPTRINPFDYKTRQLSFDRDIDSFADYCRWYLWEMERGVELLSVQKQEISRLKINK